MCAASIILDVSQRQRSVASLMLIELAMMYKRRGPSTGMNWHASSPLEPIRQLSWSLGVVDATIVIPKFSTKIWSTKANYEPTFEKILHANCPIPGLNPGSHLKELDLKGVAILKWRSLQACQSVAKTSTPNTC